MTASLRLWLKVGIKQKRLRVHLYLDFTFVAFPGLAANLRRPFLTLGTSLSLSALDNC